MIRGRPKIALLTFFLFLLLSLPAFGQTPEWATVVKVIDGDTLVLKMNGKEEKFRLIGIDCPEARVNPKAQKDSERSGEDLRKIIEMGQKATEFIKSLVRKGDRVRIEFDVQKRDQYGRLLGYVYLGDGRMLNECTHFYS